MEHLSEAYRYRSLIVDWSPIVRSYVGIDGRADCSIRLASGLRFDILDASDAWTLVQVAARNDYRIRPTEPWQTVIDIGANLGVFAVLAAKAAPDARILCYEPGSDTCRLLRRNVQANDIGDRTEIHEVAVAGSEGRASLSGRRSSTRRLVTDGRGRRDAIDVETVTLEAIFQQHRIAQCDMLKMDCEGSEYEIVLGCRRHVLERIQRMVVEYHEAGSPGSSRALVQELRNCGFRVEELVDPLARTGYLFGTRGSQ